MYEGLSSTSFRSTTKNATEAAAPEAISTEQARKTPLANNDPGRNIPQYARVTRPILMWLAVIALIVLGAACIMMMFAGR